MPSAARRKAALVLTRSEPGDAAANAAKAAFFRGTLVALAVRDRRGGAYRDRTDDLLNANQALSQLS